MVYIKHSGENQERVQEILNAAQKRFAIYGLEKTTMSEIAADLNLSKGSLYYYFPDKEQLYKAVIESEHNEFIESVQQNISSMTDPTEMVMEFIHVNFVYYRKMMNLSRLRVSEIDRLKPCIKELIQENRRQEGEVLTGIFQKGIEMGHLAMSNPEEVAYLFIDVVKGLRREMIQRKEVFYLEENEYNELYNRVILLAGIYIKGLKIQSYQK